MKKVICVVGPTATGKTQLATALATALNGEVVSCDSMQVYRNMEIGTARATQAEMGGVPHHMLGVADPREPFSVGRFVEMADPILQDILNRGKTAVLAGGTGLYVDSLVSGRTFAPTPKTGRREALEQLAEERGAEAVLELLRSFDPESAARLHPGNRRRIIRAAEVYLETGKTMTQHNAETTALPLRYDAAWIGLDFYSRADLCVRIDRRVDRMLENGLLEEIRALLDSGIPRTATALQAIGYKEFLPVLLEGADYASAVETVKQRSRQYAKRQRTWFRRNQAIFWIFQEDLPDRDAVLRNALDLLRAKS